MPKFWYTPAPAAGGGGSGGASVNDHFITYVDDADLVADITTNVMIGRGLVASLPAAGHAGFLYYASDTNQLYRDNGTSWDALTPIGIDPSKISASTTDTLTNKRITKRIATLTDAATVVVATDAFDGGLLTALSQPSTIQNPTGTPTNFQQYILRIKSSIARALTWDTNYRGSTSIPLPASTTGGNLTDYFGLQYNVQDTKWDLLAYCAGF